MYVPRSRTYKVPLFKQGISSPSHSPSDWRRTGAKFPRRNPLRSSPSFPPPPLRVFSARANFIYCALSIVMNISRDYHRRVPLLRRKYFNYLHTFWREAYRYIVHKKYKIEYNKNEEKLYKISLYINLIAFSYETTIIGDLLESEIYMKRQFHDLIDNEDIKIMCFFFIVKISKTIFNLLAQTLYEICT